MYPSGHARNTTADLDAILANKWKKLALLATGGSEKEAEKILESLADLKDKEEKEIAKLYGDFRIVAGTYHSSSRSRPSSSSSSSTPSIATHTVNKINSRL
jgi:hypothetical protein